jgi:hypothetical protein
MSPIFPIAAVCDLANWPLRGKPFDQLRAGESKLLKRGMRINVVSFAGKRGLVWGIAIFPASQKRPTNEQVQRIYENVCITIPAITVAGGDDGQSASATARSTK